MQKEDTITLDIAKSLQCWCERTSSGWFSPLSAPLSPRWFFQCSAPTDPIFHSLRSIFRSAHMLCFWSLLKKN